MKRRVVTLPLGHKHLGRTGPGRSNSFRTTLRERYGASWHRGLNFAVVIPIRQLSLKYQKIVSTLRRPSIRKPLKGVMAGALIGVAALFLLVSVRIAFDYVKEFRFEGAAKKEAQLAAADGRDEKEIRDALRQKAQDLGVPVDDNSIKVDVIPPSESDRETGHLLSVLGVQSRTTTVGHVSIDVSYDVPYRLPGVATNVHFHFAVNDGSI
jgi:hypothetical protein